MKKYLIFSILSLIVLGGLVVFQVSRFYDGKLHLVFCDVGQGDGIFLRTPKGHNLVIDGGPNDEILSCMESHMPFWQRHIDLMVLSHPHADHLNGLISILERYSVKYFATENLSNNSAGFKALEKIVREKEIMKIYVEKEDGFDLKDGVKIRFLGPTDESISRTSPGGTIGESKEFASVLTLVSFGNFHALLTGDSQAGQIEDVLGSIPKQIDILQEPHHGSKTGINREIIDEIAPKLVVISVGKNNYGHPSPEILKILNEFDIRTLRTDRAGDIEVISDGKTWVIR